MDALAALTGPGAVDALHTDVERITHRLTLVHTARMQCKRGCHACCADELTVFEAEASLIRLHHAELLAHGVAHAVGSCALLDADGACRIYAERPYVCRTQGLPLRWLDDDQGEVVELRDICPLNEEGGPIEELAADDCFTLGPTEQRLAELQIAADQHANVGRHPRVALRSLFFKQ